MSGLTSEQKDQLVALVAQQKQVRVSWLSTVLCAEEASIISSAPSLGLQVAGDFIVDPRQVTVSPGQDAPSLSSSSLSPSSFSSSFSSSPGGSSISSSLQQEFSSPSKRKRRFAKDSSMFGTISLSLAFITICFMPFLLLLTYISIVYLIYKDLIRFSFFFQNILILSSFFIAYFVITLLSSLLAFVGIIYGARGFQKGSSKIAFFLNCLAFCAWLTQVILLLKI
ncbi:MAG: hypothetical protein ACTSYG_03130 [Candidatus Heimdallarchaeota archaeon]